MLDAFQNDSIWETKENETFKQVRDNYLTNKRNFKNVEFIDKDMNLRIFKLSKKDDDDENDDDDNDDENDENDEIKIDKQKNHEIIEISNDE